MSSPLKTLYIKFTSRKMTVSLMLILAVLYFLGLVIPQKSILQPEDYARWQASWPRMVAVLTKLKLTSIYSSPYTVFFTVLFFLNLLLVTVRRVPDVVRGVKLTRFADISPETISLLPHTHTAVLAGEDRIAGIMEDLGKKGYRIIEGERYFKGVKNNYSSLGSIFFHLSFVFMLLGGIVIFATKFTGETFVAEGQPFGGTRPEYRTASRLSEFREKLPDIRFEVMKIEPRFKKMEPVSLKTFVAATARGETKSGDLDVNRPFTMGSTSILVTDVGIAPFVRITDRDGKALFESFVMLNIIRGDEDHFVVPDTPYDIRFRFWPDHAEDDQGNSYTRSYDINNPLFEVRVFKGVSLAASGKLRSPGDEVVFNGMSVSVGDIRYFGRFVITDERGGGILIAGFVLAILGLTIKFLWTKKEIYGLWNAEGDKIRLTIGFRQEYAISSANSEFERLKREVFMKKNL